MVTLKHGNPNRIKLWANQNGGGGGRVIWENRRRRRRRAQHGGFFGNVGKGTVNTSIDRVNREIIPNLENAGTRLINHAINSVIDIPVNRVKGLYGDVKRKLNIQNGKGIRRRSLTNAQLRQLRRYRGRNQRGGFALGAALMPLLAKFGPIAAKSLLGGVISGGVGKIFKEL